MGRLKRRVLKFGGTSVGRVEPLRGALAIASEAARGRPVTVVVSALAGVTNALEAALAGAAARRLDAAGFSAAIAERHRTLLAGVARGAPAAAAAKALRRRTAELREALHAVAAARSASPATRASVLALGERLSVPVFSAGLATLGVDAPALDGAALVRTDDAWAEATVDMEATREQVRSAHQLLPLAAAAVVTGFIGGTSKGETTLLGRGASDLTAALLGWALDAERVEIWSDVDGVMSSDPRLSPDARRLSRLSYAEATALARGGAKVLHPRTLEPLEPAGIPVWVGNTLRPDGPGTWIGPDARLDELAEPDAVAGSAA